MIIRVRNSVGEKRWQQTRRGKHTGRGGGVAEGNVGLNIVLLFKGVYCFMIKLEDINIEESIVAPLIN